MKHREALRAAREAVRGRMASMSQFLSLEDLYDEQDEIQLRAYLDARGLVMVPKDDVTDEMIEAYDKAEWAKRADIMNPHPTEEYHAGGGPVGYGLRAAIAAAPDPFKDDAP